MKFDLLKIAQIERDGGKWKLFSYLDSILDRCDITVPNHDDAVIWELGNHESDVHPVIHTITDKFSLIATLGAIEILGLPGYGIPTMAQYRHDTNLAPFSWLSALDGVAIKWSTAGDIFVDDGKWWTTVVAGKSGNARLRTDAQVYCNVRALEFAAGKEVAFIRVMPMLPYSQDKSAFKVNEKWIIHSEMNTDGVRIAYAVRKALDLLNQRQEKYGTIMRASIKPTQAMEDGIMAGLFRYMVWKTGIEIKRQYKVNYYQEHKERIDTILGLLPQDFFDGMENWKWFADEIIADYSYPMLLSDMIAKQDTIYLTTDLDGDRGTDLLAGAPKILLDFTSQVLEQTGSSQDTLSLWSDMWYKATHGMGIQSFMHTIGGREMLEMLLGTADSMLDRLLDGYEQQNADGKKHGLYDPGIHFSLTIEAIKRANPKNTELHEFCDDAWKKYLTVYGPDKKRPKFIDGMNKLSEIITPWDR